MRSTRFSGNFKGKSKDIPREGKYDFYWVKGAVGNDCLSSVRVKPGYEVELFKHARYRGRSMKVRSDVDLCREGMNDDVSSLVVRRT